MTKINLEKYKNALKEQLDRARISQDNADNNITFNYCLGMEHGVQFALDILGGYEKEVGFLMTIYELIVSLSLKQMAKFLCNEAPACMGTDIDCEDGLEYWLSQIVESDYYKYLNSE